MKQQHPPPPPQAQQRADMPAAPQRFGDLRMRAVAGATAIKPKVKPKPPQQTADTLPLLRTDQFYD